ncbi:MAG: hypothetical protein M0P55_04505 [Clostridiales bacterium]|nr:hypothetical protein [Clostridiales bacterium]
MSAPENNNGTANGGAAKSGGGSNRRKRNYRHFGPSDTNAAGSAPVVRNGPVEQARGASPRDAGNRPAGDRNKQAPSGGTSANRPNRSRSRRPNQNRPQQARSKPEQVSTEAPVTPESAPVPAPAPAPARQNPPAQEIRASRNEPRAARNRPARWEKRIKAEETAEDIRRDIERIEKEIWLEIAGVHTIRLDY